MRRDNAIQVWPPKYVKFMTVSLYLLIYKRSSNNTVVKVTLLVMLLMCTKACSCSLQGSRNPDKDGRLHQCAPPPGVPGRAPWGWNVYSHPNGQSGPHPGCGPDVTVVFVVDAIDRILPSVHRNVTFQTALEVTGLSWMFYLYCFVITMLPFSY